jgi:hypothetical protein
VTATVGAASHTRAIGDSPSTSDSVSYVIVSIPPVTSTGALGGGGGPILGGYQVIEMVDFDYKVCAASAEVDMLRLQLKKLQLQRKIARQREEDDLVHLGVI